MRIKEIENRAQKDYKEEYKLITKPADEYGLSVTSTVLKYIGGLILFGTVISDASQFRKGGLECLMALGAGTYVVGDAMRRKADFNKAARSFSKLSERLHDLEKHT